MDVLSEELNSIAIYIKNSHFLTARVLIFFFDSSLYFSVVQGKLSVHHRRNIAHSMMIPVIF